MRPRGAALPWEVAGWPRSLGLGRGRRGGPQGLAAFRLSFQGCRPPRQRCASCRGPLVRLVRASF
eukprot:7717629-Lingulodinium_polyedra.AAC.1